MPTLARRPVYSHHTRWIADLPIADRAVVLRLRVRCFRCAADIWTRRIFADGLPRERAELLAALTLP